MFELALDDWEFSIRLGLYPEERVAPQPVRVQVRWKVQSWTRADVQDAYWDYGQLFWAIQRHVDDKEFLLIETLASELADLTVAWLRAGPQGAAETGHPSGRPASGEWEVSVTKTRLPLPLTRGEARVILRGSL